jgi:2-polyprenyl-6-methoxyphenol hydroxylase-like FAD-dependent oxidoreductase
VLREVQGYGQRCAVCPVDSQTVYWWVAHNAPANRLIAQGDRAAYLQERYAGWPHGIGAVIAATPGGAILQNDLIDRVPTRSYYKGRAALLGDAAHPTTPNLGQGANMALDDALVLARALRDERDAESAFARYQRERLPRTRTIVERSWRFGQLTRWENPLLVLLRELALKAAPRSTLIKQLRWQILEDVGAL